MYTYVFVILIAEHRARTSLANFAISVIADNERNNKAAVDAKVQNKLSKLEWFNCLLPLQ